MENSYNCSIEVNFNMSADQEMKLEIVYNDSEGIKIVGYGSGDSLYDITDDVFNQLLEGIVKGYKTQDEETQDEETQDEETQDEETQDERKEIEKLQARIHELYEENARLLEKLERTSIKAEKPNVKSNIIDDDVESLFEGSINAKKYLDTFLKDAYVQVVERMEDTPFGSYFRFI